MYLKFNHKTSLFLFPFLFFCTFLSAQTLQYGDATTASISIPGEIDTYTFEGNTGDVIRIRMRGSSQGVDGCFKLLSPTNDLLSEECDDGGIVQLMAYELSSTGTYSIIAQDHNNNDTGNYGLSLEVLNRTDGVTMVNCGDDILSSLDNWTEVDLFGLECAAGDQLMIQMRSTLSNVECRLELIDQNGNTIASEVTQTGLAMISAFTIPTEGRYVVAAYDGNGNDIGEYGIAFQLLNEETCAVPIECGETINSSFTQIAEIDAYALNCVAGDQLVIRATDLDVSLEPNLILCDASGTDIAATMDSETAEINYNITNSGSYTLIVRDDTGNDTGEYSLSLQVVNNEGCAKYLDCNNNSFKETLDEENEVDVYSFKANEGEIINIQMRGYLNGIDAFLKVYDTAGNLLASDYSNGSMAKINELIIPEEGLYTVTAEDRNGNDTGEYGFSFQRVYLDPCPTDLSCDSHATNGMIEYFSEMDVYEFTGEAGQVITFEMEEIDAALEPMIRFYAPDGTLLIEEHKSFHVDVTDYVLPQTGRYVLVCLDKNGNDTGAYHLDFNLEFENGTSVCSTCNNGVQDGTETGVDCGGPDCLECCPDAGSTCDDGDDDTFNDVADGSCGCTGEICPTSNNQCTICPEDLILNCSDLGSASSSSSDLPMPVELQGAGGYNMIIRFSENIENSGVCDIYSAKFDSDCVGIITACYGSTLQLTPDYPTCQGPLPVLPFTITFNDEFSVYFDQDGNPSAASGNNGIADNANVQEWLTAGLNDVVCNVEGFTNDFNPSIFDAVCNGENSAQEVSQLVNFKWMDLCNNEIICQALIKVVNDSEPPCPAAGTPCDDFNPETENDTQDGNCNCIGTLISSVNSCGTGSISRDVWFNIPGYDLNSIPWSTDADISDEMTIFETPSDIDDHYATRMSGYICPPESGNYTFWISSDDQGELWLSTDDNPNNVQLIATVDGWTYPRVWDKYTSQQSIEIYLEAGRQYYVEAFQKEHEGLDNLAVGWQWPNGTMERPIQGVNLSPFTGETIQNLDNDPTANTNNGYTAPTTNSVNNNTDIGEIKVYPNPAADAINVDLADFIGQNVSLQMTNSFGQPIYQQSYNRLSQSVLNIDMSNPSILNGLYNVLVTGEDGINVTESFLIIK